MRGGVAIVGGALLMAALGVADLVLAMADTSGDSLYEMIADSAKESCDRGRFDAALAGVMSAHGWPTLTRAETRDQLKVELFSPATGVVVGARRLASAERRWVGRRLPLSARDGSAAPAAGILEVDFNDRCERSLVNLCCGARPAAFPGAEHGD